MPPYMVVYKTLYNNWGWEGGRSVFFLSFLLMESRCKLLSNVPFLKKTILSFK